MTDDRIAYQATPAATLEQHVMDSNIPKSEAEHWAKCEIERLRSLFASDGEDHAKTVRDLTARHEARITKYVEVLAALKSDQRILDGVLNALGIADTDASPVERINTMMDALDAERAKVAKLRDTVSDLLAAFDKPPHLARAARLRARCDLTETETPT